MTVSARPLAAVAFAVCLCLFGATGGRAQVSVLTQHNDNQRTGQNLQETTLTTSNVNVANFGKLFSRTVDGYIYAQPLYVPNLTIGGKTRNVVFVATEHNSVYAFDADDPNASAPLWNVNLGPSVPSNDICVFDPTQCPYTDLIPEIGITATPVIDPATQTLYVVAKTKDSSVSPATYHFFLHALSLTTGHDVLPPKEITASGFDPLEHLNRPALLLLNGHVYVAFSSVGDFGSWHGWLMAYSTTDLSQTSVFNATPGANATAGGIWAGGNGPVADSNGSGEIYLITANGTFDVNTGGSDYGDSVLKLNTAGGLTVGDYFTPSNQLTLDQSDIDFGSGGPMMMPNTRDLVAIGKDGTVRLLDADNLGKFGASNNDLQEFPSTNVQPACTGPYGLCFMGGPVFFNNTIYVWPSGDYLKAFKFNGSTFDTTPISESTQVPVSAKGQANASPLSISANGTQSGTAIVWASVPVSGDADAQTVPGVLRAFDATNLTKELWDSNQNIARDAVGNYAKFNPPTIANGKVYLATFSGQLLVYGLTSSSQPALGFVQVNSAAPVSTVSTVTVAYKSTQTSGNLNVVAVGWNDTVAQVSKVSDSAGNTYSIAAPLKQTGSGSGGSALSQAIYYAPNIKGGSNTVTVTFTTGALDPDVRILEYSGVSTSNPLDVTASAIGSTSPSDSGSATTTAANELIFGANTVLTTTTGAGPGFTERTITTDGDIAEDMIGTTAGPYSATAPLSQNGAWVMQMATFKAASGSSGGGSFTLSASGAQTVNPGSSATYNISVAGQSGFSGTVSLSVACPPNVGITCSLSPNSVSAGGQATLTVNTTGKTAALLPLGNRSLLPLYGLFLPLPGIALAGLGRSRRRRLGLLLAGMLAFTVLLLMAGCGGGGSSGGGGGATPAGTYNITVTGTSGSISQTSTATLTVQ